MTLSVEQPSTVDTVDASSSLTGWRTWSADIWNNSTLTIPAPRISVDGSSQSFSPPVDFPLSRTGADLTSKPRGLSFDELAGRGMGGSQVDGVTLSTGFDLTRAYSPAVIPAGGGTQDVTVTFVARDPSYAGISFSLVVEPNAGVSGPVEPATVVPGSVSTNSAGQSEPEPEVRPDSVTWRPYDVVVGRPYTLTLALAVSDSIGSGFPYKPQVAASMTTGWSSSTSTGQSATIADDVLGGTFTYSAGATVDWSLFTSDFTIVILDSVSPPTLPYALAMVRNVYDVREPADVDSLAADTAAGGEIAWLADILNPGESALPAPSIALDGSTQTFTPPVSFPLSTASETSLAGHQVFAMDALRIGDVPIKSGFDISRTMSPAIIPAGGATQTVAVSITSRDSRNTGVTVTITTGDTPGAQLDTSSIGWPSGGDGEGAIGGGATPTSASVEVQNPVVGKTYTLTVRIRVPNATSDARPYKPAVSGSGYSGAGVDALSDGSSTTIHDDLLGGTFTFTLGTPATWGHDLWRGHSVYLHALDLAAGGDGSSGGGSSGGGSSGVDGGSTGGGSTGGTATPTPPAPTTPKPTTPTTPAPAPTVATPTTPAPTAPPAPKPKPVRRLTATPKVKPAVAVVGTVVVATGPRWTGAKPTAIRYQWQLCTASRCVAIRGATGLRLKLRPAWAGRSVRLLATASFDGTRVRVVSRQAKVKARAAART